MFEIINLSQIRKALRGIENMAKKISSSDGVDIVKEVKKTMRDSVPLSQEGGKGDVPQAIYEVIYQSEIKPTNYNKENAFLAKKSIKNQEKVEDEIVNRFIRDYLDDVLKGI